MSINPLGLGSSRTPHAAPDSVLSTDYAFWPAGLRSVATAPLWESEVSLAALSSFLKRDAAHRPSWGAPDLGQPLFPKIAVCSWKCFPWLTPPCPGTDLAAFCSDRMQMVLGNWLVAGVPPMLRFFPFVDYQGVSEFRFLLRNGGIRILRSTFRRSQNDTEREKETGIARDFLSARAIGLDGYRVDVAVKAADASPWIVEINPAPRTIRSAVPKLEQQHEGYESTV